MTRTGSLKLDSWYRGFDWHLSVVIANVVSALVVIRSGVSEGEGIDTWEQATDLVRAAAVHMFF